MIIPIRCISCGEVIADRWNKYVELLQKSKNKTATDSADDNRTPEFIALKTLNITNACCRTHFLTNVDMLDSI